MPQADALLLASTLRSDDPDLEAPAAAAAAVASPNPNLETTAQPAAAANMHGITGTFADPSHEAAFAAQLFRMAYPAHVLLMALLLTGLSGIAHSNFDARSPTLWAVPCCAFGLGLICRVLLHRTGRHDPVRSQWMGSWAWIGLAALLFAADVVNFVVAPAGVCESLVQAIYMNAFAYLSMALINGTHGLGFACKFALNAMALIDCLVGIATCHDPELDPWLVCAMGVVVLGSATTHTAELFLRRSYAENVQAKMQEQQTEERRREEATRGRQLEERNGQLQAEKERLLYDVQRRGRPLDDDNDRSAIRRGLLAGSSQPCLLNGDTDPSEPGGAPSDTPLTLPPGPPSSASSGSVASYAQKQLAAEASPGLERVELAELTELVEVADEEVIRMVQAQPGVPMTIQRAMPMDVGAAQQSFRVVQAQVSGAYQPGVPMTIQRAVPVLCFSSQGLDSTAVATAANAQQLDATPDWCTECRCNACTSRQRIAATLDAATAELEEAGNHQREIDSLEELSQSCRVSGSKPRAVDV